MPRQAGVRRKAFKNRKWDICWLRGTRETTAVLEDTQIMSDWKMYDTLSEGKINNTATRNDLYMYSRTQPSPPHDFFFLLVLPAERLVRDSA